MFLLLSVLSVALGPTYEAATVPAVKLSVQVPQKKFIQHGQLRHTRWVEREGGEPENSAQVFIQYGHESTPMHSMVQRITDAIKPQQEVPNVPERRQGMYFRRVSVTLYCVMILTIVSLLIKTALSISRNSEELAGATMPTLTTQTLAAAARIIAYPRMMCMLFVACRMYILATTDGLGEPPTWVQACMIVATVGLLIQLISVLMVPAFAETLKSKLKTKSTLQETTIANWQETATAHFASLAGEDADAHVLLQPQDFKSKSVRHIFWTVQLITTMCIHGGVSGVIIGVITFPAQVTKVSAAVTCTVILSIVYFMVWFLQWVANQWMQRTSAVPSLRSSRVRQAGLQAVFCVRKAPCLAVVFLAARMRALQLDPPHGFPSLWVQTCFFAVTAAFSAETFVSIYIGARGDEQLSSMQLSTFRAGKVAHSLSSAFSLLTYIGLIPIYMGIFDMKDESGNPAPLSSTLTVLVQLTVMYFTVHFMQWFIFLLRDVFNVDLKKSQSTVLAADVSLRFVPMLCILFLSCRMRALQITHQRGSPPVWAQQSMYLCVLATVIQCASCLMLPFFLDRAQKGAAPREGQPEMKVDGDGMPSFELKPMVGAYAVTFLKYVALFFLFGGVLVICFAVFAMTPETAHYGGGSVVSLKLELDVLRTLLFVFVICLLLSSAKIFGILVKVTIESLDTSVLGTDVTIESVAISLCRVYVNIKNLQVQNPPFQGEGGEWITSNIIKMRTLILKVNVWRMIKSVGKEVEITWVEISGVEVNYEKPWRKTANVQMILNHLHDVAPPSQDDAKLESQKDEAKTEVTTPEAPQAAAGAKPPYTKIIVNTVNLSNIAANVLLGGPMGLGGMVTLPVADLKVPDLDKETGGEGALETKKVLAIVIKATIKTLFATVVSLVGLGLSSKSLGKATASLGACCVPVPQNKGAGSSAATL